jgi:hypothetical protein
MRSGGKSNEVARETGCGVREPPNANKLKNIYIDGGKIFAVFLTKELFAQKACFFYAQAGPKGKLLCKFTVIVLFPDREGYRIIG